MMTECNENYSGGNLMKSYINKDRANGQKYYIQRPSQCHLPTLYILLQIYKTKQNKVYPSQGKKKKAMGQFL